MVDWKKTIESQGYKLADEVKKMFYSRLMGDEGGRDPELDSKVLIINGNIMRKMKNGKSYQKLQKMVNNVKSEYEKAVVIECRRRDERRNDG